MKNDKFKRFCKEIIKYTDMIAGKTQQISSIIQIGTSVGMQSMDQHLKQLIGQSKITREAAHEKAIDKSLFS